MADLLPDQLRLMAEHFADEVGFTNVATDEDLTFGEWERRSNRLAGWFVAAGVTKGDRIALHVPPEEPDRFLVAYAAIHKAGAVAVPVSTRLVARELCYVLGHAGAVAAVSGASTTPVLADARGELPALRHVGTTGAAAAGDGPRAGEEAGGAGDHAPPGR